MFTASWQLLNGTHTVTAETLPAYNDRVQHYYWPQYTPVTGPVAIWHSFKSLHFKTLLLMSPSLDMTRHGIVVVFGHRLHATRHLRFVPPLCSLRHACHASFLSFPWWCVITLCQRSQPRATASTICLPLFTPLLCFVSTWSQHRVLMQQSPRCVAASLVLWRLCNGVATRFSQFLILIRRGPIMVMKWLWDKIFTQFSLLRKLYISYSYITALRRKFPRQCYRDYLRDHPPLLVRRPQPFKENQYASC